MCSVQFSLQYSMTIATTNFHVSVLLWEGYLGLDFLALYCLTEVVQKALLKKKG